MIDKHFDIEIEQIKKNNTTRVYLDICVAKGMFIDARMNALCKALATNISVKEINGYESPISLTTANAIAEMLQDNNTIEALYFDGAKMENDAATAIINIIEKHPKLISFDLPESVEDTIRALAEQKINANKSKTPVSLSSFPATFFNRENFTATGIAPGATVVYARNVTAVDLVVEVGNERLEEPSNRRPF